MVVPDADFEDFQPPCLNTNPSPAWTGAIVCAAPGCEHPTAGPHVARADQQPGFGTSVYQTLDDSYQVDTTYTLQVDLSHDGLPVLTFPWWQVRLNAVDPSTGDVSNVAVTDAVTYPDALNKPCGIWTTASVSYTVRSTDPALGKKIQIWLGVTPYGNGMACSPLVSCFPRYALFDHVVLDAAPAGPPTVPPPFIDFQADTWAGTDSLGRPLPDSGQAPSPPRANRFLGIAYTLATGEFLPQIGAPCSAYNGPFDVTQICQGSPYPCFRYATGWGGPIIGHHWTEPEDGYYVSTDEYVIRKDAAMFVAAGIDVLLLDGTNDFDFLANTQRLLSVYADMRKRGIQTPQITFVAGDNVAVKMYLELYKPGMYKDLWFMWQGKPLLLYDGRNLCTGAFAGDIDIPVGSFSPSGNPTLDGEIRSFFALRQSWHSGFGFWYGSRTNKWPSSYCKDATGLCLQDLGYGPGGPASTPEEAPVSAAWFPMEFPQQGATDRGRSWTMKSGRVAPPAEQPSGEGRCFAEQWTGALGQLNDVSVPQLIAVTDWNYWVNMRLVVTSQCLPPNCGGVGQPPCCPPTFAGVPVQPGDTFFVDAYEQEYSRDTQPIKGSYSDNYYMQIAGNTRRFKGVRAPATSTQAAIAIDGSFGDWGPSNPSPTYRDFPGDTFHRNWPGYAYGLGGSTLWYVNDTGRNDIIESKASWDASQVAFYAKTTSALTPHTDPNWMLLFLDVDENGTTGWNGYEYLVNGSPASATATSLWKWNGSFWATVSPDGVSMAYAGNQLELAIQRTFVPEWAPGLPIAVDFHWADNVSSATDIGEFLVSGDSAPDRRFRYRFLQAGVKPKANFDASPRRTGTGGVPVQFEDISLGYRTSWSWSFGDGTTSTEQRPSHVYTSAGFKTVSLTVCNAWGCDTATKASFIEVIDCGTGCPPKFEALPENDGVVEVDQGGRVTFVDLCFAPGTTRTWSFGDGTPVRKVSFPIVTHDYQTPGTFDVSLSTGCGFPETKESYVHVADPAVFTEIVAGPGSGLPASGNPNLPIVRGARFDESQTSGPFAVVPSLSRIHAYQVTGGYGINVGAGRLRKCPIVWGVGRDCSSPDTPSASVLTAPGPGFTYGPQVRGWNGDGTSIGGINFYAYGTLKYGARVDAGDVDPAGPDTAEEILTGPGPGSVFGPQVRGFNYDGGPVTAIAKINFYAYSTLKYGVNVSAADLYDTFPGDEMVTGPGPGGSFVPQVRGFGFDNQQVRALAKVNFNAYGGLFYGVKVAGGNYNTQPTCQLGCPPDTPAIATGPGPGGVNPDYAGHVKLWEPVGNTMQQVGGPLGGFMAFSASKYGTEVAAGELWAANRGGELLAGDGPDPAEKAQVIGVRYDDTTGVLQPIQRIDYFPFGPEETHGATVAAVPSTAPFNGNYLTGTDSGAAPPVDRLIVQARDFAAGIPDSTFVCKCCDKSEPVPKGYWNGWGSDATKKTVVQKLVQLQAALPDFGKNFAGIVAAVEEIRSYIQPSAGGILDDATRAELDQQLLGIEGFYQPASIFPSSALTKRLPGYDKPEIMALVEPTGQLFVDAAKPLPGPQPQPPPPPGTIQSLDVASLEKQEDRFLVSGPATVARWVATPAGRPEAYVVTAQPPCDFTTPPPVCKAVVAFHMYLERLSPEGDQDESIHVSFVLGVADSIRSLFVTPPSGATSLNPDTAYIGLARGDISLWEVAGVRDFSTATVTQLSMPEAAYADPHVALAASPIPGSSMLYVATPVGIDAVETMTGQYVSHLCLFPSDVTGRPSMATGTTPTGTPRVFVASGDRLLVYEPTLPEGPGSAVLVDEVTLAGPLVAVHLSVDRRLVLVTRYPDSSPIQTLVVLDSETHQVIRESEMAECPIGAPCAFVAGRPMALTIDGSHAIVSSPDTNELKHVYLGPPRLSLVGQSLAGSATAVPLDAFVSTGGREQLLNDASLVVSFLEKAESLPDPARQPMLKNAMLQLDSFVAKIDGCANGDPSNDVITSCSEKTPLLQEASALSASTSGQIVPDCPQVPPEE